MFGRCVSIPLPPDKAAAVRRRKSAKKPLAKLIPYFFNGIDPDRTPAAKPSSMHKPAAGWGC